MVIAKASFVNFNDSCNRIITLVAEEVFAVYRVIRKDRMQSTRVIYDVS